MFSRALIKYSGVPGYRTRMLRSYSGRYPGTFIVKTISGSHLPLLGRLPPATATAGAAAGNGSSCCPPTADWPTEHTHDTRSEMRPVHHAVCKVHSSSTLNRENLRIIDGRQLADLLLTIYSGIFHKKTTRHMWKGPLNDAT